MPPLTPTQILSPSCIILYRSSARLMQPRTCFICIFLSVLLFESLLPRAKANQFSSSQPSVCTRSFYSPLNYTVSGSFCIAFFVERPIAVNCNFKCPLFKKNAARQSPVLARGQELPFSQKNRIIWLADNRSSNARSA